MLEEAPADEPAEPVFEVWPENTEAVELFMVVCGQWRVVAGFSAAGYLSLDYAAVESAMNMRGVKRKDRERLFAEIRVMESAALVVLNKKRDA